MSELESFVILLDFGPGRSRVGEFPRFLAFGISILDLTARDGTVLSEILGVDPEISSCL